MYVYVGLCLCVSFSFSSRNSFVCRSVFLCLFVSLCVSLCIFVYLCVSLCIFACLCVYRSRLQYRVIPKQTAPATAARRFTSVRKKITDPKYSQWFVPFSAAVIANHSLAHVPVCDGNYHPPLCSNLYHDQVGLG